MHKLKGLDMSYQQMLEYGVESLNPNEQFVIWAVSETI
jgi:hypothetical protein